jgi:hypothetical protein
VSALYYLLGVVARINAGMWRFRINFMPSNVLAIGAMVVGGYVNLNDAIESSHNASTPVTLSIAQIHDSASLPQNYVAVTGLDIPKALYEYGDKDASGEITRVETSWSPLLDRENQRVLLVQHAGRTPGGRAHEGTVTGMLRELAPDIRRTLATHNDSVQGVPVETRYMLVAGEQPANSMSSALWAAVLFGMVALFAIASIKRNTIFQRTDLGSPVSKVKSVDSIKVGTTGTFTLDPSGRAIEQRFINMPSVLGHLEDGNPVLMSNIDASSRFMGIKTSDRKGIWSVVIQAGSMRDPQIGFFYWGTKRRPALRFAYTGGGRGVKRQAIVTADDTQTLDAVVALLRTSPAPRTVPKA